MKNQYFLFSTLVILLAFVQYVSTFPDTTIGIGPLDTFTETVLEESSALDTRMNTVIETTTIQFTEAETEKADSSTSGPLSPDFLELESTEKEANRRGNERKLLGPNNKSNNVSYSDVNGKDARSISNSKIPDTSNSNKTVKTVEAIKNSINSSTTTTSTTPSSPTPRDTQVENYLEEYEAPRYLTKNFPYYLSGYDYENRPIWIIEYGKFALRQTVEQGKDVNLLQYAKQAEYVMLKSIKDQNATFGDVNEAIAILDFDGLDFYQLTHPPTVLFMLRICETYADLIQNHLEHAIVINANYVAELVINLVRPVLGRILEKVDIYGTRSVKWLPVLRNTFPPQSIPPWYGGDSHNYKPIAIYG